MKALILAGALSVLAGSAVAGDWRLVSYDADNGFALNKEGLITAGSKKTGWVALVNRTPVDGIDYIMVRMEWDCAAQTRTGLAFVGYANGEVVESNHERSTAQSVVPDTSDDYFLRAACFDEFQIQDDGGWSNVRLFVEDYRTAQNR